MTSMFWELSEEEILEGISLISDTGEMSDHPMHIFNEDTALQILAGMWLNSDKDKTLMKLKYADEIRDLEEIGQMPSNLWFAPAGLKRGVKTIFG